MGLCKQCKRSVTVFKYYALRFLMPFITTGEQLQVFLCSFPPSPLYTRALAFSFCPHNAGFVLFSFLMLSSEHPLRAPCSLCKWLLYYTLLLPDNHTHTFSHTVILFPTANTHLQHRQPITRRRSWQISIYIYWTVKHMHYCNYNQTFAPHIVHHMCIRFELADGGVRVRLDWISMGGGPGLSPKIPRLRDRSQLRREAGKGGRHYTALTARLFTGTLLNPLAALP